MSATRYYAVNALPLTVSITPDVHDRYMAALDLAVTAMVAADDGQTGYERAKWMLKAALASLAGEETDRDR